MWWEKNINHLNNDSTVKDLLSKHGSERRRKVQTFTLAPWVGEQGV
jgi:hypothetical protein